MVKKRQFWVVNSVVKGGRFWVTGKVENLHSM